MRRLYKKNSFLIVVTIYALLTGSFLLNSCANQDFRNVSSYSKKRFKRLDDKLLSKKSGNKLSHKKYRITPSESISVGLNTYYKINRGAQKKTLIEDEERPFQTSNTSVRPYGSYSGYYKIGEPYQIFGVTYYPQEYEEFEESGISSWYGDEFHGRKTANGEIYNMNDMTAAHRTLPLPSVVEVTNLQNGRKVVVRVNDRGPFAKGRIIDVSENVAEELAFKDKGTTRVKIKLLRKETDQLLSDLGLDR